MPDDLILGQPDPPTTLQNIRDTGAQWMQAYVAWAKAALRSFGEGALSQRPVIDAQNPGTGRRQYRDANSGVTYDDVGTHWEIVGLPPGAIVMTATPSAPQGWLLCRGQVLSRADYPALFAAIGSTYGGNGSTTFGLPDLTGRGPVGAGTGTAFGATAHALGALKGEETHKLTVAEMPNHVHDLAGFDEQFPPASDDHLAILFRRVRANWNGWMGLDGSVGSNTVNGGVRGAIGAQDQPHNNLGPSTVVNFMMKA